MKIKAFAIKRKSGKADPFLYKRKLGKDDVLVRITHCSIAGGDIQMVNDAWGDTKFPLVPGHEIIGVVEGAGSEVINSNNGERIGVGYQLEACFECPFCREGNELFCTEQKVIGVDRFGGLAEHIIVSFFSET